MTRHPVAAGDGGRGVGTPTWIGNAPIRGDLVEQDSEGPDVGLVGELAVADGFWRAPLVRNLLVFRDVKRLLGDKSGAETAGWRELDLTLQRFLP